MNKGFSICALVGLIFFAGCADRSEPEVYSIDKEETAPPENTGSSAPFADAAPSMPSNGATMPTEMDNQQLPESAVNQASGNPDWQVPATWESATGSNMRRASFSAPGENGPADVAVTSFPGDVGGLTANVNRWRRQIGLNPQSPAEVEASVARRPVADQEAIICEMASADQATLAAIFEHQGNSWFFKMTGPRSTVEENRQPFLQFIDSVRF